MSVQFIPERITAQTLTATSGLHEYQLKKLWVNMRVSTVLFGLAHFTSLLAAAVMSHEGACLQGGKHKATPSPEPYLKECSLYSENSCCSELDIQDLSGSVSGVENSFWDKCGLLSPICESFLKRVVCFYRCSPDAARWPHPHHDSSLKAVPLCHSFCRDWYEACKTDMTCARDWTTDPRGQNCTGSCVPYQQMYQHGRDLCESLWSDAFMTIEDDPGEEDGVEGHSCGCLTLSPSDLDVIAALRVQENDPEELDTTKSGLRQYRAPCPPTQPQTRSATAPPQARRSNDNTVLRKRSVLASDTEGSGSGF
ncbi:riboflavin-binding protein-like isoform X2 [Myxocyprinus asiaticus]|uniref:riboflavin-binding protein-like isoform X2 n=2 Tax=Myxocyprinus asiaticus TaxID=70543 RepID=UPI0022237996|nr:riboflavin-binding protein-like isoform X2 [Myxocyprinus asiaticus]